MGIDSDAGINKEIIAKSGYKMPSELIREPPEKILQIIKTLEQPQRKLTTQLNYLLGQIEMTDINKKKKNLLKCLIT